MFMFERRGEKKHKAREKLIDVNSNRKKKEAVKKEELKDCFNGKITMKTVRVMDDVTSLSLNPYLYLGLCIFVFHPHRHTNTHIHTKRQASELFASMCCLHYWTVQRRTQRPPLKGWDSLDKPRHCIPRSLVPQRCRISTHTSGLVVRLGLVASCGIGWLTGVG